MVKPEAQIPFPNQNIVILIGFSYTKTNLSKIIAKNSGSLFIADNPYCCELLETLGKSYLTTEDFVPSDCLSQMGEKNYEFLDTFLIKIESKISHLSPPGLIKRYYFTFKRILDCVYSAFLLGDAIAKKLSPSEIKIYTTYPNFISYEPYSFEFHEYFYARSLAKALSGKFNIERVHTASPVAAFFRIFRKKMIYGLHSFLNSLQLIKLLERFLKKRATYLLTHVGYDLALLYTEIKLSDRKDNFFIFDPSKISTWILSMSLGLFKKKSFERELLRKILGVADLSLKELLDHETKVVSEFGVAVSEILAKLHLKNWSCFQLGESLAKNGCVKAVLSPCVASSAESAFLLGVSVGGGRTYQYQHGGGQGYLSKKMSEWFNSQTDYFFSYGRVVAEHQNIEKQVQVILSGSYHFEETKKKIAPHLQIPVSRKLRLLCIPPSPAGHRIYFPEARRSDLFNYHLWRQILQFFVYNACLTEKYLIRIKTEHFLGRCGDYFYSLIARMGSKNIQIISDGTLSQYLAEVDVFLTDSPETVLLEMLLTTKPVILYLNGGYAIEESCLKMLKRRVFCVDSEEQLGEVLRALSQDYEGEVAKKRDDSFLDYNLEKTQSTAAFLQQYFPPLGAIA